MLDVIEKESIQANVLETGAYLRNGLRSLAERHECIGDVRGKGLFYGVEIVRDRATKEPWPEEAARIREHLRGNGILLSVTGPLNNVMKIRPPMVFSKDNADRLLEGLQRALVVG